MLSFHGTSPLGEHDWFRVQVDFKDRNNQPWTWCGWSRSNTIIFPADYYDESIDGAVNVTVIDSLLGLVMAVAFIRALEVFEVETERMIEAMEQNQILTAERDRIGDARAEVERTLHPLVLRMTVRDIWAGLHPKDQPYFRDSRETRIGKPLSHAPWPRSAVNSSSAIGS